LVDSAGWTYSFGAGYSDFWLVKTDAAGNMQWSRTYGGIEGECAQSMVQTKDTGYALASSTSSFGAGEKDFWLIKLGPDIHNVAITDVKSSKTVGGQGCSTSINVTAANQGNYEETFNVTGSIN